MTVDLARLLADARPADLLPPRRAAEAQRMQCPLTLVGQAHLGAAHWYLLLEDARGVRFGLPAVVEAGAIRRAVAGDGVTEALVGLLAAPASAPSGLEVTAFHAQPAAGERSFDVDQTNDLVCVGDAVVVKWLLHPSDAPQPGPERLRSLAAARFPGTPRPWGLVHLRHGDARTLVAVATSFVPDALDGWDWAVDDVRALAKGGLARSAALAPAREIGGLVARMHLALSEAGVDLASAADAYAWQERARTDLAVAALDRGTTADVDRLLEPIATRAGTPVIDVHGDLHIGQILRAGSTGEYLVIDFDGSPLDSAADATTRQPAARDVAGMLASLDHVGRVVLHRTPGLDEAATARVLTWIDDARDAFLDAYRATLERAGRADLLDDDLLLPFQAQQECREYAYAERYLPHWRYVPDAALPALLNRGRR